MSLISSLNKFLGLGAADKGVGHWWAQRLTAVALIPLGLWFAFTFASLSDFSHESVVTFIQAPMNSALLVLTVLILSYHSQLGVQVVVEDYIHNAALKSIILISASFAHVVVAIVGVFSVLKISLGAPG